MTPSVFPQPLTDITQLASAVAWRGHYIDPTGFYYIGKRYYEPVGGRWLSADPQGFAASTSLYEFCANDPLNFFDPDGSNPQGTYGTNAQGQVVFTPAPNLGPPCIECHGVSAGGFSGDINGFSGLTTIPGVTPATAQGYQNFANNLQQDGPPTLAALGGAEIAAGGVLAVANSEALAYTAMQLARLLAPYEEPIDLPGPGETPPPITAPGDFNPAPNPGELPEPEPPQMDPSIPVPTGPAVPALIPLIPLMSQKHQCNG